MKKYVFVLIAMSLSACAGSSQGQSGNMETKKEMKQGGCDGSCCPHKCTRNNK